MRIVSLYLCFLLLCNCALAQSQKPSSAYKAVGNGNYVQSKNYYLLTLLETVPEIRRMVESDPSLATLASDKRSQMAASINDCKHDLACNINAVKFTDTEIARAGDRLRILFDSQMAFRNLVYQHLIPSGYYQLYAKSDPKDLLVKAWEQDAHAVNYTIDIYAAGRKPAYAQIDSISFNIQDPAYVEMVALNETVSLNETQGQALFFTTPLAFALHSLEINERNRAADYEPMQQGVNKAALTYAKSITWNKYKYTLILVPGEGPEEEGTVLSGGGMLRCRLAALQYRAGMAPFIMVSGGCVHPFKTKYNEAAEMKKFLVETLHIPERAILMEPHARHTTTNLRNCARIIFKAGFPMDKPCVTSTSRGQSAYITGVMANRCIKELGYVPYKNGARLSDTEAEFYPLANAMQIDADEPMDP